MKMHIPRIPRVQHVIHQKSLINLRARRNTRLGPLLRTAVRHI